MKSKSVAKFIAMPIAVLLLAACGSTSTAKSSSTSSTNAPVTVIKVSKAQVSGKSSAILTDSSGMTLYYFTPDSPSKAKCTSTFKLPTGKTCTTTWPPLVLNSGTPGASGSLPGTLSVSNDGNGKQVEYNGHPLYSFAGDSSPGQTNGEGLLGKWYVATPSLSKASGSTSTNNTTASGTGSY